MAAKSNASGTNVVRRRLQHVRIATSIGYADKKDNRMGGLDANWLSSDLALVDRDVAAWSPDLKEAFNDLYGAKDEDDARPADTILLITTDNKD